VTDPRDAARRLRAYLDARPGAHSLGGSVEYGPEFTAAGNRPAGCYALDRADLEAVLDELARVGALAEARQRVIERMARESLGAEPATPARSRATCKHGAEYHGPEAGCVECRCTSATGH
jgi:hypothetical protein